MFLFDSFLLVLIWDLGPALHQGQSSVKFIQGFLIYYLLLFQNEYFILSVDSNTSLKYYIFYSLYLHFPFLWQIIVIWVFICNFSICSIWYLYCWLFYFLIMDNFSLCEMIHFRSCKLCHTPIKISDMFWFPWISSEFVEDHLVSLGVPF